MLNLYEDKSAIPWMRLVVSRWLAFINMQTWVWKVSVINLSLAYKKLEITKQFSSFSPPQPRRSSIWSTCSTARCPSSAQETRVPSCRPATRKNALSCIIHSHFTITYWSCSHSGNSTLAVWQVTAQSHDFRHEVTLCPISGLHLWEAVYVVLCFSLAA